MNFPTMCYVYVASTNEIGAVKWGESGYYKTAWETGKSSHEEIKAMVKKMNSNLDVTEDEAEAMMICSMNKGLSSDKWEEHYRLVLGNMQKHREEMKNGNN